MKRLALTLLLTACSRENDPKALMNPGADCLRCHTPAGIAGSHPFTVGGTVYRTVSDDSATGLAKATIELVDSQGKTLTLRSNKAGNFFSTEKLSFPVAVEIQRDGATNRASVKAGPCTSGGCNACHVLPTRGRPRGRLHAPR